MEQPSIQVDHIGREGHPVVVVENFSPQPDRLVEDARAISFNRMGPYYPGLRAPVSKLYFEGLAETLAPMMREVFGASSRMAFDRALYSIAVTEPGDLTLPQRIPHIDGVQEGLVAIVHYLSPPGHGGAAFFRHRATGYEAITADRHRPYLDALQADFVVHGEPAPDYIDGDTALFERIAAYDAVFNRALIYRGNLLHSARLADGPNRSAEIGVGRLTVASFLTVS
jgi:hypothetical protein